MILGPLARAAGLWAIAIFNLGEPDDYLIPDRGLVRERTKFLYAPTAALVVEILYPGDDTPKKIPSTPSAASRSS